MTVSPWRMRTQVPVAAESTGAASMYFIVGIDFRKRVAQIRRALPATQSPAVH